MDAVTREPRFWHQLLARRYPQIATTPEAVAHKVKPPGKKHRPEDEFQRDWSQSVGVSSYTQTQPAYPAKYVFNIANPFPDCANDYVVFTLAATNPGNIFNAIAYNNLYVNSAGTGFCSGTAPTAIFAYDASQNNGTLSTAPVPSLDGKQIAFIENTSSSQFHVLKWHAGDVPGVGTTFPKPFNSSKLANCATNGAAAPCEYSVVYSTHNSSFSSPYVDFAGDTAYVTDDHGMVAAISPVFNATPANPPAVVWSLVTTAATNMTPATYDSVSKNVFVADHNGLLYYVRTSASSIGICNAGSPPCFGRTMSGGQTLDVANTKAVWEAPMVDSTSQTVFIFTNNAPNGSGLSGSTIVQTTTTLSSRVVASIGVGTGRNIFAGAFDNNYLTSPATGRIYACGQDNGGKAQLYAFGFTGTTINTTPVTGAPLQISQNGATCSPATEVFNQSANQDLLFVSVDSSCQTLGGPNAGCIASFVIANGSTESFPSAAAATPVQENAGTTGIVIDNVKNAVSGGSSSTNLYFLTQGQQTCPDFKGATQTNGNCAVKVTQVGLQ